MGFLLRGRIVGVFGVHFCFASEKRTADKCLVFRRAGGTGWGGGGHAFGRESTNTRRACAKTKTTGRQARPPRCPSLGCFFAMT